MKRLALLLLLLALAAAPAWKRRDSALSHSSSNWWSNIKMNKTIQMAFLWAFLTIISPALCMADASPEDSVAVSRPLLSFSKIEMGEEADERETLLIIRKAEARDSFLLALTVNGTIPSLPDGTKAPYETIVSVQAAELERHRLFLLFTGNGVSEWDGNQTSSGGSMDVSLNRPVFLQFFRAVLPEDPDAGSDDSMSLTNLLSGTYVIAETNYTCRITNVSGKPLLVRLGPNSTIDSFSLFTIVNYRGINASGDYATPLECGYNLIDENYLLLESQTSDKPACRSLSYTLNMDFPPLERIATNRLIQVSVDGFIVDSVQSNADGIRLVPFMGELILQEKPPPTHPATNAPAPHADSAEGAKEPAP